MAAAVAVTAAAGIVRHSERTASAASSEMRAVWFMYYDFEDPQIGLKTDSEAIFRANAKKFIAKAKKYHINTILFQVRVYDDAVWKSKTFPAMTYVSPRAEQLGAANRSYTAAQTLSFDPLKAMISVAHANGMKLYAWMNPYRLDKTYFLNPASSAAITRVTKAVKEVLAYSVDGIVFDDYFYHATAGYRDTPDGPVTLTPAGACSLSPSVKKANVNRLIKKVYKTIKSKKKGVKFGISPQGNLDNDRAAGADIDTWLSKSGYIDFLMPQIYWTDSYGSAGNVAMFTQRAALFNSPSLNRLGIPEYPALALYRCSQSISTDPGWMKSRSNLAHQYKVLKKYGYKGYSLFSGRYLYRSETASDLSNLNRLLK